MIAQQRSRQKCRTTDWYTNRQTGEQTGQTDDDINQKLY